MRAAECYTLKYHISKGWGTWLCTEIPFKRRWLHMNKCQCRNFPDKEKPEGLCDSGTVSSQQVLMHFFQSCFKSLSSLRSMIFQNLCSLFFFVQLIHAEDNFYAVKFLCFNSHLLQQKIKYLNFQDFFVTLFTLCYCQ